ncbi:MAG: NUDIX hydrolase [Gammaproteobacteria bacterium]|nr:NUDIX hydrolase [Gammaproteobacteria bacterium]
MSAAAPLPAATILLVRGDHAAMEVFMVVRHHQIDFASGALVFPGGKVDDADSDPTLLAHCDGASDDAATRTLQIAAIREAFEECGVLLARRGTDQSLIRGEAVAQLDAYRAKLVDGSVGLLDFLRQHELRLACDQLIPFAHWVTPSMMPKRFDTHFYLAVAPDDQVALHDGHESVDSVWISPTDALAGATDGRYTVIFPTLRNLEKLAKASGVAQATHVARTTPVVTVTPWTERRADGNYLCIPTNAGYEYCEEKMPDRARG